MSDAAVEAIEPSGESRRTGFGSLGFVVGALFVIWAAVIASFPLNDNSFFTHLATGRLILESGSVPSKDPYTYTAAGADWTVQSWLPSVLYAGAERVGGAVGVRFVVLVLIVMATLLMWRLSRPASSLILRLLVVSAAMLVATGLWGERPYMVGVIGLAVIWLALEGAVRPWLLVPLLWLWANSHGSYPLAFLLIACVLVGTVADRRRDGLRVSPTALATELRVLLMVSVGSALAVVGPLGFEVLTFPLRALTQSDLLSEIVEWQSPQFRSGSERAFLVLVALGMLALGRVGAWRLAVPTAVFVVGALVAQRNVVMATVILVPVLARAAPRAGSLRTDDRPTLGGAFAVVASMCAILLSIGAVASPATQLGSYPANALGWVGPVSTEELGRAVTLETTGNLLELLDGPQQAVFVDDRADMFPPGVFDDYLTLVRAAPPWEQVLEEHGVQAVVWERSRPLSALLRVSPIWRVVYADTGWIVACRRAGDGCEALTGSRP